MKRSHIFGLIGLGVLSEEEFAQLKKDLLSKISEAKGEKVKLE